MKRVFGIETEYGITVDGMEDLDVVRESIEMVRAYKAHGASMKWAYGLEDPHQDARGFRAAELLQDTDEAHYFELDRQRPLSFEEIKSDLVLSNGARYYNDHAHPEYSTPECTTLAEIVAQDVAGERILEECARQRNAALPEGQRARLYKNNTDFSGHSYGCHDNYLMRRDVPWERVVAEVMPFLVTRQIFAGAGKMGVEGEDAAAEMGHYQISQRADFFSVLCSIDTMNRRPLVNTRDEPHADRERYRRFHVIIGDANMSEWATAMKVGTTALVLELIEGGYAPRLEFADPIQAVKSISRAPEGPWLIPLRDGRTMTALEVQELYLAAAETHVERDADTDWILREWATVVADLRADVERCADRVDWVAKRQLLQTLREAEGLAWSDPWLQAIDLEYHFVSQEEGLYHEMLRAGQLRRIVSDDQVQQAMHLPPDTTRAYFRGRAVARFGKEISALQWDEMSFRQGRQAHTVALLHPAFHSSVAHQNEAVRQAVDFQDLVAKLREGAH